MGRKTRFSTDILQETSELAHRGYNNIIQVYDTFTIEDRKGEYHDCLVLDVVLPLDDWIEDSKRLFVKQNFRYQEVMEEVLKGFEYLHKRDLVYGKIPAACYCGSL